MPIRILKKDKSKKDTFIEGSKVAASKLKNTDANEGFKTDKKLTGGQAKLDKNKNNKLDAQDFKILRAEKAKGRGMGLQDENMKPGKPMKAVLGALALGAAGAMGAKKLMKKKSGVATPGVGAAAAIAKKKKEILGKKKGGMFKGYSKVFETAAKAGQKNTGTSTIVGVKPNVQKQVAKSKRKTYKSMEEMRKAKGFKPGETASEFNKRRAALASAKQAAKATKIGKIVLPIAAAGVAAQQYLKSKMKKKKEEPKKKMGGGMMRVPGYASGTTNTVTIKDGRIALTDPRTPNAAQQRRMGQRKKKLGALGRAGRGVAKPQPRRAGMPSLPGKRKEDSSVTLGKFMKSKYDSIESTVKKGGIGADRVLSKYRNPESAKKFIASGGYRKKENIKDAAYYKSIGLTGERGDRAVKDFFKPESLKQKNRTILVTNKSVGGSVTVKTKLGRNKPTKMY